MMLKAVIQSGKTIPDIAKLPETHAESTPSVLKDPRILNIQGLEKTLKNIANQPGDTASQAFLFNDAMAQLQQAIDSLNGKKVSETNVAQPTNKPVNIPVNKPVNIPVLLKKTEKIKEKNLKTKKLKKKSVQTVAFKAKKIVSLRKWKDYPF